MFRLGLALVVLVLAAGSVSGVDVIMIGVITPSLEVVVKVSGVEIPDSPVLVDSLGILCFSFEAVPPCLITIRGVVTEDRPAVVCKESDQ